MPKIAICIRRSFLAAARRFFTKICRWRTPPKGQRRGEWRVHFHVPIYLNEFGQLRATQDQIGQCLRRGQAAHQLQHYEVETYAWGVLPPELKQPDLAAGIAEELKWFEAKHGEGVGS